MPIVHSVTRARKDYPGYGISKGDSYYWWRSRRTVGEGKSARYVSIKHYSKRPPKRSQLATSPFLQTAYGIQETIEEALLIDSDSAEMLIDDVSDSVEELRDECEEARDRIPDNLKENETGQLLQERIEACDQWLESLAIEEALLAVDVAADNWNNGTDGRSKIVKQIRQDILNCCPGF